MNDWEWNVVRKYVCLLLMSANDPDNVDLPVGSNVPNSIREMYFLMVGWEFAVHLDETLQLTGSALKGAAESLAAAQRLAATVVVNAPSEGDRAKMVADLNVVSASVQKDERAKALSQFFAAGATVLKGTLPQAKAT